MTEQIKKSTFDKLEVVMKELAEQNLDILFLIESEDTVSIISTTCVVCMKETLVNFIKEKGLKHISDPVKGIH